MARNASYGISEIGRIGTLDMATGTTYLACAVTASGTLESRMGMDIHNSSENMVYWSYASPTTADDMEISSGTVKTFQFDAGKSVDIYLTADTTTTTVKIHEWK
jgi:hypothetical protein